MKLKLALLFGFSMLLSCSEPGNDFRSKIAVLDWGADTCYVIGHKTPDVDAVCSSVAYAELMRSLGYNCEAKVCGNVNKETEYVSEALGFCLPGRIQGVAPGRRVILTDHSEYAQSADGVREAKVLQIIDHHAPGDIYTGAVPFVYCDLVGSACTLVWELYGQSGIIPTEQSARAMLAGVMSDTHNLTKKGTTARDSLAWFSLSAQLGLSPESLKPISEGMAEASRSYEGMSDEEIFLSDVKSYVIHDHAIRIGSVDWLDAATADAFMDRMLKTMEQVAAPDEMLFAKVDVSTQGCYVLYYGPGAEDVAAQAFGQPVRSGVCHSDSKLNRKRHVVPMITNALER